MTLVLNRGAGVTARFNSVIKILVLWVRSEPFGSAEKLTRIVFWILKKINHEITKLEKHENGVVCFVVLSFRDFAIKGLACFWFNRVGCNEF
jgi:hypothetical protein